MTHAEFKAKVLPLSEPLYRIALYMLEDEADASDAVQDLMLKLWRERDSLDKRDNLKAWCSTMMRNLCVDRIRAATRRRGSGKEIELSTVSPESGLEDKERLRRVMEAMADLPETQRRILHMKVFEDLSYEEIEEKTGLGNASLRVLLSKARKTLKAVL